MKSQGRVCLEEKETIIDGVNIRAAKWLDIRGVSLASTFDSAQASPNFFRSRIVTTYNKFMGRVDLLDGLI